MGLDPDARIAVTEDDGRQVYRRRDLAEFLLAKHGDTRLPEDGFSSGTVAEQLLGAAAKGGHPGILRLAMDRVTIPDGDPRWNGLLAAPLGFWNHWIGPWCHLEWDRTTYLTCFRMILEKSGPPNLQLRDGATIATTRRRSTGHAALGAKNSSASCWIAARVRVYDSHQLLICFSSCISGVIYTRVLVRSGIVEMPKTKPRILPELHVEGRMRARLIRDVLDRRASERLVGRERELQLLSELVERNGAVLAWVHGLPGIGKSALLQEFFARAATAGVTPIALDCRFVEPSPEGFLFELQRVLKRPVNSIEEAREAISALTSPVLVLDSYEVFALLDGWIRQDFIPGMPEDLRVVICSRFAPGPSWRAALGWQDLILTIPLSPLTEGDSRLLLERAGTAAGESAAIYRLTGGHPLALVLASGVTRSKGRKQNRPDPSALVQQLTRLYLTDVGDPSLRRAVEAASVIRRTTHTLLAALLPELYHRDLYDELAALPIVESTSEGLMIHAPVQEAVSSYLRSSDPHRFNAYRRAAWLQIRRESAQADRRGLWRYTADLLYLVEHLGLRESFFPTGAQDLSVEQARPDDHDPIFGIAGEHDAGQEGALAEWWRRVPEAFRVMRAPSGEIAGFYIATDLQSLRTRMPAADPVVTRWLDHLRQNPLSSGETALFLRRWLSKSAGEAPSPVQAACWLDVKRSHMALRPRIRRCYGFANDVETFAPMLHSLGFRVVSSRLLMLEFGPGSFDGWLADLISQELGLKSEQIIDAATRELVHEEERVSLTVLEFGVLDYLRQRAGKAVSRAELLEQVWEKRANSGSNVVDVVVRSLRRKLASRAWMIATVRGLGYRFQTTQPE